MCVCVCVFVCVCVLKHDNILVDNGSHFASVVKSVQDESNCSI